MMPRRVKATLERSLLNRPSRVPWMPLGSWASNDKEDFQVWGNCRFLSRMVAICEAGRSPTKSMSLLCAMMESTEL